MEKLGAENEEKKKTKRNKMNIVFIQESTNSGPHGRVKTIEVPQIGSVFVPRVGDNVVISHRPFYIVTAVSHDYELGEIQVWMKPQ